MGKATRSLSGASQKKYFRELLRSVDGVTPDAADALTEACEREIAQVRVRLPIPDRGMTGKTARLRQKPTQTQAPAPEPAPSADAHAASFDPFAFSVVVVVTKEGREGLARKLDGIASAADLKALAKAQHLALPEGDLTAEDLRMAIIEGALQRIANRKAAAS